MSDLLSGYWVGNQFTFNLVTTVSHKRFTGRRKMGGCCQCSQLVIHRSTITDRLNRQNWDEAFTNVPLRHFGLIAVYCRQRTTGERFFALRVRHAADPRTCTG